MKYKEVNYKYVLAEDEAFKCNIMPPEAIHTDFISLLPTGEMVFTPGGLEGKNVARKKADKCYYDIIRDSIYAYINGVKCELYLPPALRHVGEVDIMTTAFFVAVEVGHDVRND